MDVVTASDVETSELTTLDDALAHLPQASPLTRALGALVSSVKAGTDVVVAEADESISPASAAKLLGMSRAHLYKLLDDGTIESFRVGNDRRITRRGIATYSTAREADGKNLAERFAHADRDREGLLTALADTE